MTTGGRRISSSATGSDPRPTAPAARRRRPCSSRIPGLTTAFFSILSPHKHIGAHRGPWRGVLRYHLALKIPEPAEQAGISVGGQVAHWEEGRSLLFDDGYEHFAWNDTDGVRVVLFVDVIRPLRPPADRINRALITAIGRSPYVRDARNRHDAWERRFEALRAAREAPGPHREQPVEPRARPRATPSGDPFGLADPVDGPKPRRTCSPRSTTPVSTSTAWPSRWISSPSTTSSTGRSAPPSLFRGRQVVMLGSNNYLGLTTDERVRAAAVGRGRPLRHRASPAAACSTAPCASTASSRSCWPTGWALEAALVFTTGYVANLGLIGALVGRMTPPSSTPPLMPAWSTGPASPTAPSAPSATTGPTACGGRSGPGGSSPRRGASGGRRRHLLHGG